MKSTILFLKSFGGKLYQECMFVYVYMLCIYLEIESSHRKTEPNFLLVKIGNISENVISLNFRCLLVNEVVVLIVLAKLVVLKLLVNIAVKLILNIAVQLLLSCTS